MVKWKRSAVVTVWIRFRTLVISLDWFKFLLLLVAWASCLFASSERYMCDWQLASQVAYECFSFTAVPQTDLRHFNLESSLGSPWSPDGPDRSTQTSLDTRPQNLSRMGNPDAYKCFQDNFRPQDVQYSSLPTLSKVVLRTTLPDIELN